MFKKIFKYTALTYIVLFVMMFADSNITGWHLTQDHAMANIIFFSLAFFWWVVPIVVTNMCIILDWALEKASNSR